MERITAIEGWVEDKDSGSVEWFQLFYEDFDDYDDGECSPYIFYINDELGDHILCLKDFHSFYGDVYYKSKSDYKKDKSTNMEKALKKFYKSDKGIKEWLK